MSLINSLFAKIMPILPRWAVKPFAKPYVAGEKIQDVTNVVKNLNHNGFSATIDILGEFVDSKEEAIEVRNQYSKLIKAIAELKLDSTISVKLTHLGLELDYFFCKKEMHKLVEYAKKFDVGIAIDMESSKYTDSIYQIYQDVSTVYSKVGAVTQAYLYRSINDIKKLDSSNLNLRICKGIYNESSTIAIKNKEKINENFEKLVHTTYKQNGYICIATHDLDLISKLELWINKNSIPLDRFEFQVLYGVPMKNTLNRLKSKGIKLTVYVPFGKSWFDYSMRRLKENPKIISYVLKNLFKK